jgi:hypothetical protein
MKTDYGRVSKNGQEVKTPEEIFVEELVSGKYSTGHDMFMAELQNWKEAAEMSWDDPRWPALPEAEPDLPRSSSLTIRRPSEILKMTFSYEDCLLENKYLAKGVLR